MTVWLIMDEDISGHHSDALWGVFASEQDALAANAKLAWGGGYIVEREVGTFTPEGMRNLLTPVSD